MDTEITEIIITIWNIYVYIYINGQILFDII